MFTVKVWDSVSEIGYKQITTFFSDFSIAERFGVDAIKDTYRRAFNEWKSDYKYLTELVLVLNRKSWQFYSEDKPELSKLYAELYEEANDYAWANLKGEDLRYYYITTD